MEDNGARRALDALVATDLTVAGADELGEASRSVARLQAFLDHAKVQITRRSRQLAADGDTSAEHVLLDEGRLSGKDARTNDERDRICQNLPEFEAALATGDCTAGHLDALANHTKDLTDEERSDLALVIPDLIDHAASQPIGLFDRTSRKIIERIREMHRPDSDADELDRQRSDSKVSRWTDRSTGMKHTLIALDPVRDASLWTAIDHHLRSLRNDPANADRSFAELQIDAVLAAVSSTVGTDGAGHRVPEIVLHVDLATACHGRHADTLCETVDGVPVPVPTAQRMCCDALVQAVIVNPDGTVDQLCRELRTANRKQRRMLAAMYATCAHPHCEVGFTRCRIHHVEWFTRGGTTVLANLLPLCERHHHLVHEGRWNLRIDDRRRVTWVKPDGTIWLTDHGPPRTRSDGRVGQSPPGSRRPTHAADAARSLAS